MASEDKEEKKPTELKAHVYGVATGGQQVDEYSRTTKAIGEYCGRLYGKEMKNLVIHGQEAVPVKPVYPGEKGTDEQKAIWSKEYDRYLKKADLYDLNKAKVFETVLKQCTKVIKNKIEGTTDYATIEAAVDVVAFLQKIKDVAHGANEKLYSHLQAVESLLQLGKMRQRDGEDLVDYYRRFMSVVERYETSYGRVNPVAVAEKSPRYSSDQSGVEAVERNKLLAFLLMDRANQKEFGPLMRSLGSDFALGNDLYPKTLENAMHVLTIHAMKRGKMTGRRETKDDDELSLSFQQAQLKCWECGEGHLRKDCPKIAKEEAKKSESTRRTTTGQQHLSWCG